MSKRIAASVALVGGFVLAGCSSNEPANAPSSSSSSSSRSVTSSATSRDTAPIGKTGTPRGGKVEVSKVKRTDAAAVAIAAVKGTNTVDLKLDASPVDGQRRVAGLMTPQLAKVLSQPLAAQSAQGGGFPGWDELRSHDGYSSAEVMNVSEHGDGEHGNTATQRLFVTVTGHDAHGWKQQLSTSTVLVTMTRTKAGAPWQVQSMQALGQ